MYANSEGFQVLAITTMVSSFVAEWNDRSMKSAARFSLFQGISGSFTRDTLKSCEVVLSGSNFAYTTSR